MKLLNASTENPSLQIAGVIAHARKYYEKKSLNEAYTFFVSRALDSRLATLKHLEIKELTHLKLIALSLGKERDNKADSHFSQ